MRTYASEVIISAIPLAATSNMSSANARACLYPMLPNSRSLSLFIINMESTCFLSSAIPFSACFLRCAPSNENGIVTIATTSILLTSSSMVTCLAISAITGAAPVPVPPPIPAVINNILVLSDIMFFISSAFSRAAFSATSGFEPAPKPLLPSFIFLGIGLCISARSSVLHTMKSTPFIP